MWQNTLFYWRILEYLYPEYIWRISLLSRTILACRFICLLEFWNKGFFVGKNCGIKGSFFRRVMAFISSSRILLAFNFHHPEKFWYIFFLVRKISGISFVCQLTKRHKKGITRSIWKVFVSRILLSGNLSTFGTLL